MASTDEDVYAGLDRQLNSHEVPLAQRFRALFTLKSLGGLRAIEVIAKGEPLAAARTAATRVLTDRGALAPGFDGESALLGHELAYCLGQLKDPRALPILTKVLEDDQEHVMVRHEVRSLAHEKAPPRIGAD